MFVQTAGCTLEQEAASMPKATNGGHVVLKVRRRTSKSLATPWMLLLSASIIYFSGGRTVNGVCLSGFAILNPQTLSALTPTSSAAIATSIMECIVMCTRDAACRQLIYVPINGTCYILTSLENMGIAWNTAGQWLVSYPSNLLDHVISFAAGNACDWLSADRTCAPSDGAQYAGTLQVVQIQHYYSNASNDSSDVGQVHVAYFNKLRSDTALRVQWRALIRTHHMSNTSCGRYYVTFNGAQCSQPSTIDMIGSDQTANNEHRTSELDGICSAVPAGNITVAINIGPCIGYSISDMYTGYLYGINTFIWEISPSVSSSGLPCEALSIDNIQYQASSEEVTVDPDTAVATMMYNKRATDTLLKVTWLAATRVYVHMDIPYCARWYVTVNGAECTPKADFIIGVYSGTYNYTRANTKTRTLEGYCYGLVAGMYAVTVHVGNCRNETGQPDANTGGSGSVSRFIVAEVRASTQMQYVQPYLGNVIKIPFFNLRHWSWTALKSNITTGTALSVIYSKLSNSSGLHVRFLSDMGATRACKWFVTFNGSVCSSPGPIESASHITQMAYYYQPGFVDGVCYGYKSGNYNISLKVTLLGGTNCYTGFDSTTQLIVQETQLDSAVTCPSAKACV